MTLKQVSLIAAAVIGLTVVPLSAQQQQRLKYNNPTAAMEAVQGFNIVLLVGESAASGPSLEEVPAAARKALNEMRDFLPFKHYRVLDSHWTSCCASPMRTLIGRLQGVSVLGSEMNAPVKLLPRMFAYSLDVTPDGGTLGVRFSMMPTDWSSTAGNRLQFTERESKVRRELAQYEQRHAQLVERREQLAAEHGARHPDLVKNESDLATTNRTLAALRNELGTLSPGGNARSTALIDSSFPMQPGETVVVGTSRLGGDKALIAIVTAARRGSGRR
jgi:hypothetical protein